MNIGDTIAPNSDQLDAVDLLAGPRTFTIERVSENNAEQPFNFYLTEFPRPWRPGKSMRRVLVAAWGPDAAQYVGRRLTLWCDPTVRFGGQAVGGVRITHLSHIDKPVTTPLLIARGKSAMYTVQPLKEEPARPSLRTEDQSRTLAGLMREVGLTERDEALALFSGWVGRDVNSTKELTVPEASKLITKLEAMSREPVESEGQLIPQGGEQS